MLAQPLGTLRLIILATVAVSNAGCGGHHESNANTQVAVKVDSYEVTISQLNDAVSKLPNVRPDQVSQAKGAVLEKLVTQALLVNRAQQTKLDRDPGVVASVEAARREILARAYAQRIADAQTKPSSEEVHAYYVAHPALFENRKTYSLKELKISRTSETEADVGDAKATGKSLDQLQQVLQGKKISFATDVAVREPESLPIDFVPVLSSTKDGGLASLATGNSLYVAQVVSTKPAPVSESVASPAIMRFLIGQRSQAAVNREIASLRSAAVIQYKGEFSAKAHGGQDRNGSAEPSSSSEIQMTPTIPAVRRDNE